MTLELTAYCFSTADFDNMIEDVDPGARVSALVLLGRAIAVSDILGWPHATSSRVA